MRLKRQSGTILIITLWMVGLLSALLMGTGSRLLLESRLANYHLESAAEYYGAHSGILWAKERLSKDTNAFDSLYLCGVTPLDENEISPAVPELNFGETRCTVQVTDEERKISVNTAPPEVLMALPGMTEEVVAALLDWRDEDDNETPGGAEDSYYRSLKKHYSCRNAALTSYEELLLVKGMTPAIYESIIPFVTVWGDGAINLNTVSASTLKVLGLREELVDKMMVWRNGFDGLAGTVDDPVFEDKNKLDIPGLNPRENAELALMKKLFKVQSGFFRIEARASVNDSPAVKTLVAIVKRDEKRGSPSFTYFLEA